MLIFAIFMGFVCACIYLDALLIKVNSIINDKPLNLSAGGWGVMSALFPFIFIPLYIIMHKKMVEAEKRVEDPVEIIQEDVTSNTPTQHFSNSQVMKGLFISMLSSIVIMGLTGNLNDDYERFTKYEAILSGGVICGSYNEAVLFYTIEKKPQDILLQFIPPDCVIIKPGYELVIKKYSSTPHPHIIQVVDINDEVVFTDLKYTNIKKRSDRSKN